MTEIKGRSKKLVQTYIRYSNITVTWPGKSLAVGYHWQKFSYLCQRLRGEISGFWHYLPTHLKMLDCQVLNTRVIKRKKNNTIKSKSWAITCSATGPVGSFGYILCQLQPTLEPHADLRGTPVAGINKQPHLTVIVGRLSEGKEAVGVGFPPQHDLWPGSRTHIDLLRRTNSTQSGSKLVIT